MDELTQEREEHEEERSGILEHKQDTRTVSLIGRSNRPNRIPKGENGKIHKKGSWVVVSPTANRAVPIKSPEDERLASSLPTSRGLESTKGSSPHAEEPSPQGGGRRPLEVMEFYSTLPQTSLLPLRGGELLFIVVVQNGVERREAGLGAG